MKPDRASGSPIRSRPRAARRGVRRRSTSSTATTLALHREVRLPRPRRLAPRARAAAFSFNTPHGACPRCTGLGAQLEIDPDLIVPDTSLSIAEGAVVPWSGRERRLLRVLVRASPTATRSTSTGRGGSSSERSRTGSCSAPAATASSSPKEPHGPQAAVRDGVRGRSSRTCSGATARPTPTLQRERLEEYMSMRPCPDVPGARLKPEVLAVHGRRELDPRLLAAVRDAGAALPRRARADADRAADRPPHPEGDPRAARLPRRRRPRLPAARPRPRRRSPAARRSASGWRRRSARS